MSEPTQPEIPATLLTPQSPTEPLTDLGASPDLSIPSVPGHVILSELGRGGMGVVYRATQTKLGRVVALKMILSGAHAGNEDRTRFFAEARAVAGLSHPNIVHLHEVGESEGRPFFSLEFVEGGSLERRLRDGPMTPTAAAELVETLARAMHHAHKQGIVHRDLKPANILLAGDGTPKITDFGLAKNMQVQGNTQSGAVMGTPAYMAPEQAAGRSKEVGPTTDVHALGAILYECLIGKPPFSGGTILDTLVQVMEQLPERPRRFNRDIDPALESICLKCLEKEPARRYPDALALAEDLAAYRRGEEVTADQNSNLRMFRAILQESRHTEVLRRAGRMWMAQGIIIFLIMLWASILLWSGVENPVPYIAGSVTGISGLLASIWHFRLRGGPSVSPIERQMAKILALALCGIVCTVVINFARGYKPMELLPLAVLEAGIGIGAVGVVLGGSFYVLPLVCFVTGLLMALFPELGPLPFGIAFGLGIFIPGLRYSRKPPE